MIIPVYKKPVPLILIVFLEQVETSWGRCMCKTAIKTRGRSEWVSEWVVSQRHSAHYRLFSARKLYKTRGRNIVITLCERDVIIPTKCDAALLTVRQCRLSGIVGSIVIWQSIVDETFERSCLTVMPLVHQSVNKLRCECNDERLQTAQ